MNEPKRLHLLRRLTEMLAEITPGNGYQHDLTGKVFRGRMVYGSSDPLPLVSILEPPLPEDGLPTPIGAVASFHDYELLIQGFVEDDKENPTDPGYYLLADVKKRLVIEKKKLGKATSADLFDLGEAVQNFDIGMGVVRPADEVSSKCYFYLLLRLSFLDDLEEPFMPDDHDHTGT